MKTIVAIGGAVIKTAWDEIKEIAEEGLIDVLIHNGGSLFHDFQRAMDPNLGSSHSYPLSSLIEDYTINRETSEMVLAWCRKEIGAPLGSLTAICERADAPILMFTVPGADFWHLFFSDWSSLGRWMKIYFDLLCQIMSEDNFRFICMGSAVVHPEIFTKALAVAKPKNFSADAVDFLDAYRPRTRVACFGKYYRMEHKKFLDDWRTGNILRSY